jgi:hypothetical protein
VDVAGFCDEHLGSPVAEVLFGTRSLSAVTGVRLADGREVVVKERPKSVRLRGCGLLGQVLSPGLVSADEPQRPRQTPEVLSIEVVKLVIGIRHAAPSRHTYRGSTSPRRYGRTRDFVVGPSWRLRACPP